MAIIRTGVSGRINPDPPFGRKVGAVSLIGYNDTRAILGGIASRLSSPVEMFEILFEVLEEGERSRFDQISPHYVRTGAVKESLTTPDGFGAIRDIHGVSATFGTFIWYAKFLRKIGGSSGVPRGRKREGPNLVLKTSRAQRRAAVKLIGENIMRGL